MKSSTAFKNTIQNYLVKRANEDILFAAMYLKPNKNLDNCINYILDTVQKSGCNGFDDNEIYSMAVHYYDEDSIQTGKPINCAIVVNHVVELTEEEKHQAHKDAVVKLQEESYFAMKKRETKTKRTEDNVKQMSLF